MLDLRLINTFVVVGRTLHFGRAAEVLHATQPGVTQHIQRLEEQLGVVLLKRSKRSVALTEAGQVFLRHALKLVEFTRRMQDDARAVAAGLAGHLRLGFSSSIVLSSVPQRISAFRTAHPQLQLRLEVHSGDQLQELLDAFALDAVITTLPFGGESYDSACIDRQAMGVAMPFDHPLASRKRVAVRALARERFIVVPRDKHPQAHDRLTAALQVHGHSVRIGDSDVSFPNLIARVAMGEGVALVPQAYRGSAPQAVAVVPVSDATLAHLEILLISRRDSPTAALPRLRRFLAVGKA